MNYKDLWVAEYCYAQKVFHVCQLQKTIELGERFVEAIIGRSKNERSRVVSNVYIPFFVGTIEEVNQAIKDKRKKMGEDRDLTYLFFE